MRKYLFLLLGMLALAGCQSGPETARLANDSKMHVDDFNGTPVLLSVGERFSGNPLTANFRKKPTLLFCKDGESIKIGERRGDSIVGKIGGGVKNYLAADQAALLLIDMQAGEYQLCGFAIVDNQGGSGHKKMLEYPIEGISFSVGDEPLYLGELLFKWLGDFIDVSVSDQYQRDHKALQRAYLRLDDVQFSSALLPIPSTLEIETE